MNSLVLLSIVPGDADPLANDENFLLSMLSLEELGATGNKVLLPLRSVAR